MGPTNHANMFETTTSGHAAMVDESDVEKSNGKQSKTTGNTSHKPTKG